MKLLILLIISFFLFLFSGGKKNNDLTKEHLKGQVKSIKICRYSITIKNGKDTTKEFLGREYFKYDINGNRLWESRRDSVEVPGDSSLLMIVRYCYKYDEHGNIAERIDTCSVLGHPLIKMHIYKYDDRGNMVLDSEKIDNILYHNFYNKYDSNNNMIRESECVLPANRVLKKDTYRYNGKGNRVEMEYYNSSNGYGKERFINDSNGNVIEQRDYEPNGKLSATFISKYISYDKLGNWRIQYTYTKGVTPKVEELGMEERKIEYY